MKQFGNDFKAFIMRGNIVDMAIGVIIGAAFGKIVTSLVNDIITPWISLLFNSGEMATWSVVIGSRNGSDIVMNYGLFLQNIVDFLLIAFSIFVALRYIINRKKKVEEVKEEVTKSDETLLLEEIRDLIKLKK